MIREYQSVHVAYGIKNGRFLWKRPEVHPLTQRFWKAHLMYVPLGCKNQNSMTTSKKLQTLSCSGLITPKYDPSTFASRTKSIRRRIIQNTA